MKKRYLEHGDERFEIVPSEREHRYYVAIYSGGIIYFQRDLMNQVDSKAEYVVLGKKGDPPEELVFKMITAETWVVQAVQANTIGLGRKRLERFDVDQGHYRAHPEQDKISRGSSPRTISNISTRERIDE